MNNRKGLTLIELIIAIAIGSIVITTAYNILFLGLKGHSSTFKSFQNQSDVRYAIEITNNAIKFSTVGFAVTKDDFKPKLNSSGNVEGLVKPWNYIGLGPDKKSIVHYKYEGIDDKTGKYKIIVLAKGLENLSYELKFDKVKENQEDKLIKYILKINNNGKEETITTEVEAINAIHVIDWGDAKKPAIALAYRTEETPEIHRKPIAAMSMVLDTSGSMKWGMNGQGTKITQDNPERLSLLKKTLTHENSGLFSILNESDVYISLIPFSNNANITKGNYVNVKDEEAMKFHNVKLEDEKNILKKMVSSLTAEGGTNTGDGMRRAYHQLLKFNNEKYDSPYNLNKNQEVKNYMIVLVDGVTTFGSRNVNYSSYSGYTINEFIKDERDILGGYIMERTNRLGHKTYSWTVDLRYGNNRKAIGHGSELDKSHGENYVREIGEMIQDAKLNSKLLIDQAFVIGYSNATKRINGKDVYYELESLTNIAKSLGIDVNLNEANEKFKDNEFVFVATDKDSLKEAFENIGGYIKEELWQIEGPRLNP